MKKFGNFLKSVGHEMKLVEWPTRKQNLHDTGTVITTSVFLALFLGACDWVFQKLIALFVGHK